MQKHIFRIYLNMHMLNYFFSAVHSVQESIEDSAKRTMDKTSVLGNCKLTDHINRKSYWCIYTLLEISKFNDEQPKLDRV